MRGLGWTKVDVPPGSALEIAIGLTNLTALTRTAPASVSFVVSGYLQVVRHYDAIQTGVIFTAATVGLLASSLAAARLARRYAQRT